MSRSFRFPARLGRHETRSEVDINHEQANLPRVTEGVSRIGLHSATHDNGLKVDRISYLAGAHTHWHLHTGEQVLYGEYGRGWVKFAGQPRLTVEPGRMVAVPIETRHWHGATPDVEFAHLAVTAGGDTVWLGEVSEDEYYND